MATVGFWQRAAARPHALAVVDPDGTEVSTGALLAGCNRVVHGLRRRGLGAGDAVAIAMRNRRELLEVYFAAMQAGWYYVPVHPEATAAELAELLRDSGAKALVFDATAAREVERVGFDASFAVDHNDGVSSYASLTRDEPDTLPEERTAGEVFPYTSGTTGRRRGVRRALSGVSPEERARGAALHLRAAADIRASHEGVHLVCAPLCYGAALVWCVDHLHVGHPVVLMDRFTPEGALECIQRHRITSSFMVPTHFRRLLAMRNESYDLSSLQHVVHSGAPCPIALKRSIMEWWGPVLYETYAATEGPGTQVGPQEWLAHPGTVGRAGSRVRVLRDDDSECATGEVGRVFLRCERPFEYHADPEKTARNRVGDYFTVGDIGYVDDDGYLFLCDRSDDVVVSGGVNVYPAEVEAVLGSHDAVADVGAFGVPDDDWGERLIAAVVPRGREPGSDELVAFCRERLAGFKCPRSIIFTTLLPRDESGKLSRRSLREQYASSEATHDG